MSNTALVSCPYKGLQPYTSEDRAYFFGRERDQEIICANLYAAPLTILYGASGVGKSSVLLAGVTPQLKQVPRIATVVFRDWQDAGFLSALKTCLLHEVSRKVDKEISVSTSLPFDDFIAECVKTSRVTVFFIFDQFEEYFLYHAGNKSAEEFDTQLALAINRKEINANFLVSLREDGLSKLDRFQGRIPNMLSNMLRLEHLDRASATRAIRKPLDEYNRTLGEGEPKVTIEDELVEALLNDLSKTSQGSTGAPAAQSESRIETPLLQLMLTRLWNEERRADSSTLRASTLTRLGRAEQIIRTHLDDVVDKLSESQRDAAARLFRYLVTPSGAKIALTPRDLASYARLPEEQITATLVTLSSPEVRILRPVAPPPDKPTKLRYEIFHDVLADAILDWCMRYEAGQQRVAAETALKQERARSSRLKKGVAGLAILVLFAIAATVVAVRQRDRANQAQLTASIALKTAQEERDRADRLADILKDLSSKSSSQIDHAVQDLKLLQDQHEFPIELVPAIQAIIKEKEKEAGPKSKQASLEANKVIGQIVEDTPNASKYGVDEDKLPTRVFIEIQSESQKDEAEQIKKSLNARGFLTPRINTRSNAVMSQNELRYFWDKDLERAKQALAVLTELKVPAKLRLVQGYESTVRPRTVELGLASVKPQPSRDVSQTKR